MNSMSRICRFSRLCKAPSMPWLALHLSLCVCIALPPGAQQERMNGMIGSSVLLDPKVKADPSKQEIIWTFFARHRSPLTILHHIPDYGKWAEPSEQFRSRLQFIPSNGSLMINGLKVGDQGDYGFMAADRTLKIIQLFLFGPLSEDLIVINTIFIGSAIQLTCKVDGDPLEYQWWKNGVQVCCNAQMRDGNRTLLIQNDAWHESATYVCEAHNPVSSVRKDYILTRPDAGFGSSLIILNKHFTVIGCGLVWYLMSSGM
ncbi:CD48 antigen-like isoform X1 [Hypanus sabinus]|uniref:CD48 antigen-like isoform X1 n=2 Tax=Hypanus sabinus TaxID=79690 RepID=UPI0028C49D48|nr:CD48 antigen-like isoform X1 [Hypanus sabinus]